MLTDKDFVSCCSSDFAAKYAQSAHPVFRDLERAVLGCDFGGTSWTTRAQADELAPLLALKEGVRWLEVGAGSGWPALYLAAESSSEVTLLDLPVVALRRAMERAVSDGMLPATEAVCASGCELPFQDASFEAIGHSDVLCCLPDKVEMLRECRRVARPAARQVFFVIAPAPGLDPAAFTEAVAAGPPFVEMDEDYVAMSAATGWKTIGHTSLTAEYLVALRCMVKELQRGEPAFREVMGDAGFEEELVNRERQVRAVHDGLLVRERFVSEAV